MCSFCVSHGWANHRWYWNCKSQNQHVFFWKLRIRIASSVCQISPNSPNVECLWMWISHLTAIKVQQSAFLSSATQRATGLTEPQEWGKSKQRMMTMNVFGKIQWFTRTGWSTLYYSSMLDSRIHEQFESKFEYTPKIEYGTQVQSGLEDSPPRWKIISAVRNVGPMSIGIPVGYHNPQ